MVAALSWAFHFGSSSAARSGFASVSFAARLEPSFRISAYFLIRLSLRTLHLPSMYLDIRKRKLTAKSQRFSSLLALKQRVIANHLNFRAENSNALLLLARTFQSQPFLLRMNQLET